MSEFRGAGSKPGLEVWRVENKVPKPWPAKDFGKFYEGDSYICLKTVQKKGSSSLTWDIFFWLGSESSQDEQGIAAYKTVELDESLGGAPTQHRETQGYESEQFLQCFKSVQYLKGGVASGFNKVERGVHEPQLLQIKGKRVVRVSPVPLSASSLNSGDVFVLVMSKEIIQWNGAECNKKEKAKALEVTKSIKDDERGGKCVIKACEQGAEPEVFWETLGGKGAVKAPVSDDAVEAGKCAPKLLKVSDATGSIATTEVASGALKKSMLDTTDVFLLDLGSEVFVWVGKGASADERKVSMKIASDYAANNGTKGTQVSKVMEGTESTTFKSNFATWTEAAALSFGYKPEITKRESANILDHVGGMITDMMAGSRKSGGGMDEFSGVESLGLDVWRIEDFKEVPLEKDFYGQFYAGDSYIVKYTYKVGSKTEYMVYFWQGAKSSADEKGASALIAKKMDDDLGGAATQCRVVMGKEPGHFVKHFGGKMVVHSGGKASGFANSTDTDSYDCDGVALFHVRGSQPLDTRAVQVEETAASLNSGDCFVLLTPETTYLWQGKGANEAEVAIAKAVGESLQFKRGFELVLEGSEPEGFWAALGGAGEYPSEKVHLDADRDPMLFHCSNETGSFKVEPIFDFAQADLEEDDVFILDTYTSVYVWLGSECNEVEQTKAAETAAAYIKAQGYAEDTSILTVRSGSEPRIFTSNFLGWDAAAKKKFVDPYEAKLAAALAANPPEEEAPASPARRPSAASGVELGAVKDASELTLTYDELKGALPSGVDPSKKEQYLADDEFAKVMGSPRAEFNAMKPWKQAQIKKAKGLF